MNFISLLSEKIELAAIFVSNIIINFLPFMSDILLDKPENIMVIIGFGGQGLFAARFLIPVSYTHLTLPTNREV